MNKQQLKEIVIKYKEHMPEPAGTLLDILGFEGLCELSDLYGGSALYIPKQTYLFSDCLRQSLLDEYDGANQRDLRAKYGVCTRTVYKIVARNMQKNKAGRKIAFGIRSRD